jgi:transcriptional regulator with XRE-family HTH domain
MSLPAPVLQHTFAESAERIYDTTVSYLPVRLPGISALPGTAVDGMSETFADRLRRLRREQGYTIVDLASAVGASEGTIRQLESGNVRSPNFLLGIRLADQLRVDPRYLALGEGMSIAERLDTIERRLTKVEQRLASFPAARR